MSDIAVPRTVCGLWVIHNMHEYDLTNFSWQTKVIDNPDGDDDEIAAEQFVRQELMAEVGQQVKSGDFILPDDIVCGPQHPIHLGRETYYSGLTDLLSLSHPWVSDDLISRENIIGPDDLRAYTVCGVTRYNWTPVCWDAVVSNPLMAYYVASEAVMNKTGQELLLCAVHTGQVDYIER